MVLRSVTYLGHHWAQRREAGEAQLTVNWVKAFSDFLVNWTFGRAVTFRSPRATSAIVPSLLNRVWTVDNDRPEVLWDMGNMGSVSGDCFVKVAYQEPSMQPVGADGRPVPGVAQRFEPGRVRILPLNSSFCLDEDTEILTRRGWLSHADLQVGDEALSLDPETDEIVWDRVERVNRFDWDGPVTKWSNERFEAVSTDDHRWIVQDWRVGNPKYRADARHRIKTTAELNVVRQSGMNLITGGGVPRCFADEAKWSDELVELVGWAVTGGHVAVDGRVWLTQDEGVNPDHCARIRSLLSRAPGCSEYSYTGRAQQWRLSREASEVVLGAAPDKRITPEFLCSLTYAQARLFRDTLMAGDGGLHAGDGPHSTEIWYQSHTGRIASFQMLCAMLGRRTQAKYRNRLGDDDHPYRSDNDCEGEVTVYSCRTTAVTKLVKTRYRHRGVMWCPTTSTGTWYARKRGVMPRGSSGRQVCYWTGNCFP